MMEQIYQLIPFKENDKNIYVFLDDIDKLSLDNQEEHNASSLIIQKIFYEKKFKIYPFLFYKHNEPIGITWIEVSTNHYGNINCHVMDEAHSIPLMTAIKNKGFFDNKMMEIVHFHQTTAYKDACFKLGLTSNIRERMYLWLNSMDYFEEEEHPFEFRRISKDDIQWCGHLSWKSHQISKDYIHYAEMTQEHKRIELEKLVWDDYYGKVVESASIIAYFNNKPVGYCTLIEVKCWGYDNVPWIFDICIDPAFHGQGIGKAMSKRVMNILIEQQYPIVGLAVTKTNIYAKKLYENLGFEYLDRFYEFINIK